MLEKIFKKRPSIDGELVSNLTYIVRTEPCDELKADMVIRSENAVYYLYKNTLSNRKIYKKLKEEIEQLKQVRDNLIFRLNEYQQEV